MRDHDCRGVGVGKYSVMQIDCVEIFLLEPSDRCKSFVPSIVCYSDSVFFVACLKISRVRHA